jgi:renalase
MNIDVLIIGAGLAGLMAARSLVKAGKRVLLLEKGKTVGGRMGTRRMGEGVADHGAQYFTVRDPAFAVLLDEWRAEGLAFEWSRGWSDGSLSPSRDGHPRYAINGGMNALTKHLAVGLDVRLNVRAVSVSAVDGGWEVRDEPGTRVTAKTLLLTPPVPQSLALLDAGRVTLTSADRAALEAIEYLPCITAVVRIEGHVNLPAPGAIQRLHAPITWIADNRQKGISPVTLLTVEASAGYSYQLWDRDDEDIMRSLRVDLMPFMDDKTRIVEWQIKRWRYSQPSTTHTERYLLAADQPAPLMFAGDAFGGARVEGAVLSGMTAGDALKEWV